VLVYLAMIDSPNDKIKFESIYNKYRFLMLHVAEQILHNHHDAEDAVHQAFISIIENLNKISDLNSPKTRSYIVVITERKAIDILRQNNRRRTVELNEETAGVEFPFDHDHPIATAITKIPPHYREILMLRYHNGFSVKEIASILNISGSGVRKLLGRAKAALQEELEKEVNPL